MKLGRRVSLIAIGAAIITGGVVIASSRGPSSRTQEIQLAPGTSVKNVQEPFDYFHNSWTVIGLKDYPDATRVSPDGEFLLGDKTICQLLVGKDFIPLGNTVRKTLDSGYLPIIRYDFILNGSVEFVIEALARPLPAAGDAGYDFPPADANFLTMIRVTLRNRTAAAATGMFGLAWKTPAPLTVRNLTEAGNWSLTSGDAGLGTLNARSGVRVQAEGPQLRLGLDLPPGQAETAVFCLPFHALQKPHDRTWLELSRLDFDSSKTNTSDFWKNLLGRGARLRLPEEKVTQAYLASIIYQFIGRDKGELHAGEGFYDELYLRDGAYQAISLAQAGYLAEARQSLEMFLRFQRDNGQFLSQEGQLDANGYAVWALVEYGELSEDNIWLWNIYPKIEKSIAFIRNARATEKSPDSPFFGILPRAPADGENLWAGHNHIVGYDWWNLRAVQSAVEAARLLAKNEDVNTYTSEFEDYRAAILRAIDRTGLPYIPPSYEKEGTHWGNLEAIFPSILIDPHDRRMTATLDYVRESFGRGEGPKGGLVEGVMQWTPKTNAIHPYMSLFVTNSHIIRGDQDKAVDGFYSFLVHSTSTHGFPEGVYYQKREAWGDTIPHLWAAALYVTTLRNMLVREEDRDLHLLSAVPSAWLEPGKFILFEDVPTRFGKMSLSVEAQADALIVRFTRPERIDPDRLIIHVPPDLEITEVGRCGKGIKMSQARDVLIPGWSLQDGNTINICIRRQPGVAHRNFSSTAAELQTGSR